MGRLIDACKAIDAINEECDNLEKMRGGIVYAQGLRGAIPILDTIPTAEPQTAEWVMVRSSVRPILGQVCCNKCEGGTIEHMRYKFCPNCGAKMVNADANVAMLRMLTLEQLREEMEENERPD